MDIAEMNKALKILETIFEVREKDDLSGKASTGWVRYFKGLKAYLRDKNAFEHEIIFIDSLYGEMASIYEENKTNNKIVKLKIEKRGSAIKVRVEKSTRIGKDDGYLAVPKER